MSPLISITIPSFKIKFLKEAIESILAQTYNNWELIIVDDASPEDIKSVVDKFDDKRIKYFRNEKNCGAIDVVDNWNICLKHCSGEYVICMGDDDMLTPDCLEEYGKLIEKYPGLHVYHAMTDVSDENGNVIGHQRKRPEYQTCAELILHRWSGDIQFIGDFCYEVKSLRKEGGYYKLPLAWASDDITAVRAASYNGIANTQTSTFLYRSNTQSITQSKTNGIKLYAKSKELEWYADFLEKSKNRIQKNGTEKEKAALEELTTRVFFEYFNGQIELHLIQYFEESLWNLLPALKIAKHLKRTKGNVFYMWHKIAKKKLGIKI